MDPVVQTLHGKVRGIVAVSATAALEPVAPIALATESSSPLVGGQQPDEGTFTAHDSYRHEAFLYTGESEFLAGTVQFILEGLKARQPMMVAVPTPHIDLLRVSLGKDADQMLFADMSELGRKPALTIERWRNFVQERAAGGQPVRGIREPIWPDRRPAEVAECQLTEALLNLAIEAQTPLWLLCAYDVLTLDPDVIAEAQRTHRTLVEGECPGSTDYGGPDQVQAMFEADLPPVDAVAAHQIFGRDDLRAMRADVIARARGAGLSAARGADLALAVHEVATNSIVHGSGERVFRLWLEKDSLVCEFGDNGRITNPMTGRRTPPWDAESGRGLWIANQLCDLVQVRSSAAGTTIRLRAWT